jgi:hypothetical protein
MSTLGGVTVMGGDGNDTLTVDFSGGDPIPTAGLSFLGEGGNDTFTLNTSGTQAGSSHGISFTGSAGADTLNLNGGTYYFGNNYFQGLSSAVLNVGGGGSGPSGDADLTINVNDATVNYGDPPKGTAVAPMALEGVANAIYTPLVETPPPPPPPLPPAGTGLLGQYFDNFNLSAPRFQRVDPGVNFDWGSSSPDRRLQPDTFSVQWTGWVMPLTSGAYTFYTRSDDGVRLWVDGKLLINHWNRHPASEDRGSIQLQAGQPYAIKLAYFEWTGLATIKLLWSGPSVAKGILPVERLFRAQPQPWAPAPSPAPSVSGPLKPVAADWLESPRAIF